MPNGTHRMSHNERLPHEVNMKQVLFAVVVDTLLLPKWFCASARVVSFPLDEGRSPPSPFLPG